jgi:hypothetical protein
MLLLGKGHVLALTAADRLRLEGPAAYVGAIQELNENQRPPRSRAVSFPLSRSRHRLNGLALRAEVFHRVLFSVSCLLVLLLPPATRSIEWLGRWPAACRQGVARQ